LAMASDIARDGYDRARDRGDETMANQYRRQIVLAYVRETLK
jgi:hypothetical protein